MPRQLSIFLSFLMIFGMIQLGGQVCAQSPKEITNSIGMKLVLIPKGTFQMTEALSHDRLESLFNRYIKADGDKDPDVDKELLQDTKVQVTISKDYYLGVTEVTQGQFEKLMRMNPSSNNGSVTSMHPVDNITWHDAVDFCKKLSDLTEEKIAGRVYRLPTEAEWEYACRAGSNTAYSFGDSSKLLGDYAWFLGNAKLKTHPVGQKKANAWGLYDMHGSVSEWCSDWYAGYPKGAVSDPVGPKEGSRRVYRGGSRVDSAAVCQSANRNSLDPSGRGFIGFRLALSSFEIPKSPEAGDGEASRGNEDR